MRIQEQEAAAADESEKQLAFAKEQLEALKQQMLSDLDAAASSNRQVSLGG
jgi:F0F1-type ATP synthase membrane subunit b/b'